MYTHGTVSRLGLALGATALVLVSHGCVYSDAPSRDNSTHKLSTAHGKISLQTATIDEILDGRQEWTQILDELITTVSEGDRDGRHLTWFQGVHGTHEENGPTLHLPGAVAGSDLEKVANLHDDVDAADFFQHVVDMTPPQATEEVADDRDPSSSLEFNWKITFANSHRYRESSHPEPTPTGHPTPTHPGSAPTGETAGKSTGETSGETSGEHTSEGTAEMVPASTLKTETDTTEEPSETETMVRELRTRYHKLQSRLSTLPTEDELSRFPGKLQELAEHAGFSLHDCKRESGSVGGGMTAVRFECLMEANIWQFVNLVSVLESHSRFFDVREFRLAAGDVTEDGDDVMHSIQLTIETFVAAEDPELESWFAEDEGEETATHHVSEPRYEYRGRRDRRDVFVDPRAKK